MNTEESQFVEAQNRFVAYFDILGFKDFSMKNDIETVYSQLKTLKEIFNLEYAHTREELGNLGEIENILSDHLFSFIFSDSVLVVSEGDHFMDFILFSAAIVIFMRTALKNGIPLKGGIAHGKIIMDKDNNLFCGAPIIDAYLLEEDLQYMGVVVHHSIERYIKDDISEEIKSDTPVKTFIDLYKELKTTFKYGYRQHSNIDYTIGEFGDDFNAKECIENFKLTMSGDPRKYIDNTLEMLKKFDEDEFETVQ